MRKRRRWLVAADGHDEWKEIKPKVKPYRITLKPEQPFAFAELWEHCQRGERVVESCTIIVTVANDLTRDIHDRLPT